MVSLKKLRSYADVIRRRRALGSEIGAPGTFAAFIDFEYIHYALGDLLTKEVEIACTAVAAGKTAVDLYIGVDPSRPAAPTQGFIMPENYMFYLDAIAPAMLCQPMLRSLHILRDGGMEFNYCRVAAHNSGAAMWPSYDDQVNRAVHYPYGHQAINRHFKRHGALPTLKAPKGYDPWAKRYLTEKLPGKFVVSVNLRQSRLTETPATTYRDADLTQWNAFFARAQKDYPDVHFLRMGGYSEWDREVLKYRNVTVTRKLGLELGHELALLANSNMFMGSSSGFATMATFTHIPYLICDIEAYFAGHAEVAIGDPYPFAGPGQHLLWHKEDSDLLFAYLETERERWIRAKPIAGAA